MDDSINYTPQKYNISTYNIFPTYVIGITNEIQEKMNYKNTSFYFKQTGANFYKDGKHYNIKRNDQMKQANIANINYLK